MKKLLLSLALVVAGASQAQNLLSQNFDVFPAVAAPGTAAQWVQSNQSTPTGPSTWAQGGGTAFTGPQAGAATSFALVNFNSTAGDPITGVGDISNWLFVPAIDLLEGDVISFWTRQGGTVSQYPDRLEMRIAPNYSDFSVLPTTGSTDVGDFTTLALSVNPNLTVTGYPLVWTNYTYTVTAADAGTSRIAFRYYVTDGGPGGDNSNIIGLDTFSVDRPLSTQGFFASNFAIFPNPASSVINVSGKNNGMINNIQLTDMNGRIVKTLDVNAVATELNISDLNAGVYFLKVSSDLGVGTTKVIKS